MSALRWNATVDDSPGSEPFSVVGDLVLAVRTPRSREFVTVEVGRANACVSAIAGNSVLLSPRPYPRLEEEWQGEMYVGETVLVRVAGGSYRLTLERMSESGNGRPWVRCEFCVERD
jgi:hypothetical protein